MGQLAKPAAAHMRAAAQAFLESLSPDQRRAVTAPFDTPNYRVWTYLPGPRAGLALIDMDESQRELAIELLATGLSDRGLQTAETIRWLESVLRDFERSTRRSGWQRRHPLHFWVRVLGDPRSDRPWAWRLNGHHLAVHITVVGGKLAGTPQFFGANPAQVLTGPHEGHRTLPAEEDLARELLASLDPTLRASAVVASVAPDDILTRADPLADLSRVPVGLTYGDMPATARDLLTRLIRLYVERVTPEIADDAWRRTQAAGLEGVTFAWAGSQEQGMGHYYSVSGPTFLLEYDNTQHNANHVHTVWRDLAGDWGIDLLAEHYHSHHQ